MIMNKNKIPNKIIFSLLFFLIFNIYCIQIDVSEPEPDKLPLFTSTPLDSATVGIIYTDTLHAIDNDKDTLAFTLLEAPSGTILSDSTVKWMPEKSDTGRRKISVMVDDGNSGYDTLEWFIYVNAPPFFPHDSTYMTSSVFAGAVYCDTLQAMDIDGNNLVFSFIDSVPGITLNDSIIKWNPGTSDTGRNKISVRVSDIHGASDTLSWTIKVEFYFKCAVSSSNFSARSGHTCVVLGDKMLLIGGIGNGSNRRNDVWVSKNGTSWALLTGSAGFSARNGHSSIVFNNRIWVIGGTDSNDSLKNDVWYSGNGTAWTKATDSPGFSPRSGQAVVVFHNKLWLIGGNTISGHMNDVWYTSDGTTWTQATASANFSKRTGHTALVFGEKLWILGGEGKNDVWYSKDGITWVQTSSSAGFSSRENHASVVFHNKLWVIGGYGGGSDCKNDVWYSKDGISWIQATASAGFSPRFSHTATVFHDRLWIIGGVKYNGNYYYKNDIWTLN